MKKAVTYLRCAYVEQTDKDPLQQQREITKKLAEKYKAEIIGSYADAGVSGLTMDRLGMSRMLSDLKNLKPDYLIVTDLARLSRNNIDIETIINNFRKTGIKIITEKGIDESSTIYSLLL